jgi:hypothetical protein
MLRPVQSAIGGRVDRNDPTGRQVAAARCCTAWGRYLEGPEDTDAPIGRPAHSVVDPHERQPVLPGLAPVGGVEQNIVDSAANNPIAAAAGTDGKCGALRQRGRPLSGQPMAAKIGHAPCKSHRKDGNGRRGHQLPRRGQRALWLVSGQPEDSILEAGSWTIVGALLEIATKTRLKRIFVHHGLAPAGKM